MNIDPQLKMVLTSMGGAAATAVATWAVHNGLISAGDQVNVANSIVTLGSAAAGAVLVWYAHRQTSQASMIKAVNAADNGVKVVADNARSAPLEAVSAPQPPVNK